MFWSLPSLISQRITLTLGALMVCKALLPLSYQLPNTLGIYGNKRQAQSSFSCKTFPLMCVLPLSFYSSNIAFPPSRLNSWLKKMLYKLRVWASPLVPPPEFSALQRQWGAQRSRGALKASQWGLTDCSWQRNTVGPATGDCMQPTGSGGHRKRRGGGQPLQLLLLDAYWELGLPPSQERLAYPWPQVAKQRRVPLVVLISNARSQEKRYTKRPTLLSLSIWKKKLLVTFQECGLEWTRQGVYSWQI